MKVWEIKKIIKRNEKDLKVRLFDLDENIKEVTYLNYSC